MSGFSEWMTGLRGNDYHPQAITEDIGGLPRDYIPNHWSREYIEQRRQEIEEAANRYADELAERRRKAEAREAELRAARDRVIHHMWYPSDDERNNSDPPRWSFECEHHLDIDPATGEIINSSNTLPNEEVLFNSESFVVNTSENNQLTTISSIEPAWELSVSDAMTDKYKEMEKRVEEQDKTIAEMKSIIENLQDIVYQRKLDKEAETLVL